MLNIESFGNGHKKALILSPIQAAFSSEEAIKNSLEFLFESYHFSYVDSLQWIDETSNIEKYCQMAFNDLSNYLKEADLIIGFSFGGTILQYLLPNIDKKKCILFSAPTCVDELLNKNLSEVRDLLANGFPHEAMILLNQLVGQESTKTKFNLTQPEIYRLKSGFDLILDADARSFIDDTNMSYLHLYGDCSELANKKNILINRHSNLVEVPNAKMRVLQDNPDFCQKIITHYLEQ